MQKASHTIIAEVTISERIRILRNYYKLSVQNFAKGCGVSNVTIFNFEKNGKLSTRSLLKIALCYGTTPEWLLNGRGGMLPYGPTEIAYNKIDGIEGWKEKAREELELRGTFAGVELEQLLDRL